MNYYIEKTLAGSASDADTDVRAALANEGFGIVMEIDIQKTLLEKTGTDIGTYRILGACNPGFAGQAIKVESNIGTLLPCNVIIRQEPGAPVTVAAVDPVASMQVVENEGLAELAAEVKSRIERAVNSLDATN